MDFLKPSSDPQHVGRFAEYEVLDYVGKGGMGIVLKALDPVLNRIVAIKVLDARACGAGDAAQRFLREARAAAAVSHPHVVVLHAVGQCDSLPYLVMEFISGITLEQAIARKGPLEIKEILRIAMQIAFGLAAAHAQGVVHRDIKPGNIMLENGVQRVKITDFGLARSVDDTGLTRDGTVIGTPEYMAPERARGELADHRADLFSLGSVMYAMCTGRSPFRSNSVLGSLRRVMEESPRAIRELNPDIPPWLAAIVERLHAKSPASRYQSAEEVAVLLGQHLTRLQQPAPPAVAPPPRTEKPPAPPPVQSELFAAEPPAESRSRLVPVLWAVAAGLLLGVVGILCVMAFRMRHRDGRETALTVPNGSKVTVSEKGGVRVLVKTEGGRENPQQTVRPSASSAAETTDPTTGKQAAVPAPEPPGPQPEPVLPQGWVYIVNRGNGKHLCPQKAKRSGSEVVQVSGYYPANEGESRPGVWRIETDASCPEVSRIRNQSSELFLAIDDRGSESGVCQTEKHDHAWTHWQIEATADGFWTITNQHSGLSLETEDKAARVPVRQAPRRAGAAEQEWRFEPELRAIGRTPVPPSTGRQPSGKGR